MNVEEYRFYYRALLPWIMNEYDRILYLGADTIIKTDVAQLCHEIIPTKKTILASLKKDGMDLDVMLMDVKGICERIKQSTMIRQLHICANNECLAYEKVFDNMIHPLAQEWNVQPLHVRDEMEIDTVRETAKIIHYKRMPKPWINPLMMMAEDWWAIARRTEYYEEILRRMSRFEPDNRSGVRVVLDEVFPKGTKRREIVKCIIKPFGRKEQ